MSLLAKIEADLKQSMLAKSAEKTGVLRMLKSSVKYASIEKGGAELVPTDAEVLAVLRKEVKKRQDSINSFVDAKREDLAAKERSELAILQTYLPAALSEKEMEEVVKAVIAETGITSKAQMGAVMKAAQAKAEGRADGKTLSQIVQKYLH
jgi:uncharacterized protein YqeY